MSAEQARVRWWARPIVAVLGGRDAVDGLWPLLGLTMFATVATSAFYSFVGIWAIAALHATPSEVGWLLLVNAVLAIVSGSTGGVLSDRIGRRPVLVACLAGQGISVLCCAFAGDNRAIGFALVAAASTIGTAGSAARNSLVADMVGTERRTQAYSSLRIVNNLAVVIGPALIGATLLVAHWSAVFVLLGTIATGSALFARLILPSGGAPAATAGGRTSSWQILRDVPFLTVLGAILLVMMIYVAYSSVLPIVLVSAYKYPDSMWGFLAAINPILVVLCQGTLTRRTAAISANTRVALGTLLMGMPWLVLTADHHVATIAAVVILFVVGEMLWAPASQALVADLAPAHSRGAYQGAYGSTMSVAMAIGPLVSLHLLDTSGARAIWMFLAVTGAFASAIGWIAVRAHSRPHAALSTPLSEEAT